MVVVPSPRRGAALSWLLLLLILSPARGSGQGPDPCAHDPGRVATLVAETRGALEADAFVEAYGPYLRDLDAVESEAEAWIRDFRTFETDCRPYQQQSAAYETDRLAYESACAGRPLTEAELPGCQARKGQLDGRRAVLERRRLELLARAEGFQARTRNLEARVGPALDNAAVVLDPDNVENALRLYVSWVQKQGSGSACHDFARIAEKLGERVANQRLFLGYLVRNLGGRAPGLDQLVPPGELRPFRFDASGFQPRFYADVRENQVRHALAYMAVGYTFHGTGADLVSQLRDELAGEQEDYWLGVEAGHMGFQLRTGVYDARNFGRAIRGRLCQ